MLFIVYHIPVVLNLFLCSSPLANQPIGLFPLERYIRKAWFPVRIIFVLRKKDNRGTIRVSHIWYKQNNFLIPTTLLVGFLALLLGSQMVNVRDGGRQGTILKGIRLKAPAKSSPLELQKFPPGGTFPPVKNHCYIQIRLTDQTQERHESNFWENSIRSPMRSLKLVYDKIWIHNIYKAWNFNVTLQDLMLSNVHMRRSKDEALHTLRIKSQITSTALAA